MDEIKFHIGELIKEQVEKQGLSVCEFAKRINCVSQNVYYIYKSESINYNKLITISKALNYDFIDEIYFKHHNFSEKKEIINLKIELSNVQITDSLLDRLKEIICLAHENNICKKNLHKL